MDKLQAAERALADAEARALEAAEAFAAGLEANAENVDELEAAHTGAEGDVARAMKTVELQRTIAERKVVPAAEVRVVKNESIYRPDGRNSFISDIVNSKTDMRAADRLRQNQAEAIDKRTDGDSTTTYGGYFIPPLYMGELWAELPRAGRPFVDKLKKLPLPNVGNTITIPAVTTGTSVASQAGDNGAVSQTTMQASQVSADLVTIAGKNDYSRQAIERTFPGLDQIIFSDLTRAYNAELDRQALIGAGSGSHEHVGLKNVGSINTVTYTGSSQAALAGGMLDAIQKVYSTRFEQPDLIVMHPRRAAYLADPNGNTDFPLFQNGSLFHSMGEADRGFVGTFQNIPVVIDPNIPTTDGVSTNEDSIYVLYSPDMYLFEGDVNQVAFEEVLSSTLEIRLMVWSYSFLVLNRQAKSICKISGSGLATPSF